MTLGLGEETGYGSRPIERDKLLAQRCTILLGCFELTLNECIWLLETLDSLELGMVSIHFRHLEAPKMRALGAFSDFNSLDNRCLNRQL